MVLWPVVHKDLNFQLKSTHVYSLSVLYYRLLPPSFSAQQIDQKNLSEIQQHLTNATDVLIRAFLPNKVFIETLTGSEKGLSVKF